jgi:protein TonB
MPAYLQRKTAIRPRERVRALCAAAIVELAVGLMVLRGLQVELGRPVEAVQRLISIKLVKTLPPTAPSPTRTKSNGERKAAPGRSRDQQQASAEPKRAQAPTSIASIIPERTPTARAGGGSAVAEGAGPGGGEKGAGAGSGGGTDLEQIAGEITPRDYPRNLGNAGIGGRVGVLFIVGVNGRVTSCAVTRSSGVPELDALTCRLIEKRFRYRPSTDRYGRPIPDEVEGEHEWTAGG